MICVKLKGGLGNQLFSYATARRLALKHDTELWLDLSWYEKHAEKEDRPYELDAFNIKAIRKKKPWWMRTVKEKHFHFDPKILDLPNNVCLDGYWQSYKYFEDINETIKKELFNYELPIQPLTIGLFY